MIYSGTASDVTELYVSIFGRAPDQAGLDYWVQEVMNGSMSVANVGQSFFDQTEAQVTFGGTSDADFINQVYQNSFNRDADIGGHAYWLAELEAGNASRDRFVEATLAGAKDNVNATADQALLEGKLQVATYYVNNAGYNSELASTVISNIVTADSVTDMLGTIDYYNSWIGEFSTGLTVGSTLSSGELLDEASMWSNISNDLFWTTLIADVPTMFVNTINFWEIDDSLWTMADIGLVPESYDALAFLDNSAYWADPQEYMTFMTDAYTDISYESLYLSYDYTSTVNPDGSITYMDNAGFSFTESYAPDGYYTYSDSMGVTSETTYNADGSMTTTHVDPSTGFTSTSTYNADGSTSYIDSTGFVSTDVYNADGSTTSTIIDPITGIVSTLIFSPDGTHTYSDSTGLTYTEIFNIDGSSSYTDSTGISTTQTTNADGSVTIAYTDPSTGLTSTEVIYADNMMTPIDTDPSTDIAVPLLTVVNNTDGSTSYTLTDPSTGFTSTEVIFADGSSTYSDSTGYTSTSTADAMMYDTLPLVDDTMIYDVPPPVDDTMIYDVPPPEDIYIA